MSVILPIDEIIENGIAFNLFSEAPHDVDELRRILREQRERKRFT
jgi:hypothetical protein